MARKTDDIPFQELTPEEQELDPRARFGWSGLHEIRPLRADGTPATLKERAQIQRYLDNNPGPEIDIPASLVHVAGDDPKPNPDRFGDDGDGLRVVKP